MRTRNRILSMLAAAGLAISIMSTTAFATDSGGCSHEWEWKSDNDVHWRECSICGNKTSDGSHHWDGGIIYVATSCTDGGKKIFTCTDCGRTDIEPIKAPGHRWGTTWASDATHHWHECENSNCPVTDNSGKDGYAEHTGGTATCTDKAVCEICGVAYGETNPDNHTGTAGPDWHADNSAHWKEYNCCKARVQTAAHSGDSNATCSQEGRCWYCGVFYYGDHSYGAFSFDENKHWQKCLYCDNVQNEIPHNFSEYLKSKATCVSPEVYDMICTDCDYQVAVTQGDRDPDNHDLVNHAAKAPTCTEVGWAAYKACQREGCGYTTIKKLPALGHRYGEWMPNGSHTHLASCKRGCGHRAATTCAALDYALPTEGADAYEFTLCPVCGEVNDGTQLELIGQTTAQPITRWLPAGEQVLRLGTLENGELILTAAFEISGQLTQPTGQIQFTLPAKHLEGFTLTILHPDGTEEPLDCTVKKDKATFTLDFTNQKAPAMTLCLTPEA